MTLVCGIAAIAGVLWLQSDSTRAQEGLSVTANFDSKALLTPGTAIEFHLSRALRVDEGHLAVLLDHTDLSSLFVIEGTKLVYVPTLVPLPFGESRIVIYLVGPDGAWRELQRFEMRVVKEKPVVAPTPSPASNDLALSQANQRINANDDIGSGEIATLANLTKAAKNEAEPKPAEPQVKSRRFGFDKFDYAPSLTLAIKSQPAQFDFPASLRPAERATFTDGTLQFSVRNNMTRGRFSSQAQFDFAGSTFQPEALRFGTLGSKAPQIDLSSYLVELQLGRAKVVIGHTSVGSARHLINSFSSRGITVTVPLAKRFDFSVAAMNGTNVVGYGNFFGVGKSQHQLRSATVGIEFLPKRPGGLRLEIAGLSAYIQALNSFSQGSVNDVERSKGGSVRLIASDKPGRIKFDGGFTRSQYRNPADPLLYQGTNTVAVPFLTRNARYADINLDLLRGLKVTKSKQLNLSVALRHEQVDPLFKSLGASAGADKRQNDFQLTGSLGEISFQAGHSRFNDNLRRIASILLSLTRSTQFSVALPAAVLWGGNSSSSKFAPLLSYSRSDSHQFGSAIPINGGFETDPGAVPNQYSTNQSFSADWQIQKLTIGSSYNRSFTNNQQRGRERADFLNQTMGIRVGFNPRSRLGLNFELTRDSANELESNKLSRTWRAGPTVSWNLNKHLTWTAELSNTIARDRTRTSGSRNTEFDTQFAYHAGLEGGRLKKVQAQMFIRYADRYARSHDLIFQTSNLSRIRVVNAGLNFTFF